MKRLIVACAVGFAAVALSGCTSYHALAYTSDGCAYILTGTTDMTGISGNFEFDDSDSRTTCKYKKSKGNIYE